MSSYDRKFPTVIDQFFHKSPLAAFSQKYYLRTLSAVLGN